MRAIAWITLGLLACAPTREATSAPPSVGQKNALDVESLQRDLSQRLPKELSVRVPDRPAVRSEITVFDQKSFETAHKPHTRIVVVRSLGDVVVSASDVEVVLKEGVKIESLSIEKGTKRVRVVGGTLGRIELRPPAQFWPKEEYKEEWLIEDVSIEGVTIDAKESGILLRGKRILLFDNAIKARDYSVWCGDTDPFQSEDVVLLKNRFSSSGPESTVRLVSVLRSVVADNELENPVKHNYRLHGRSDLNYAGGNLFRQSGVMFGTLEGDKLGSIWFVNNRMEHRTPDLFNVDEGRIDRLIATGNAVFSDVWKCLHCTASPMGWQIDNNVMKSYQAQKE